MLTVNNSLISTNCPKRTFATNLCGNGLVAGDDASAVGDDIEPGWVADQERVERAGLCPHMVAGCEAGIT